MRLFWKTFFVSLGSVVLCTVFLTAIISYREAGHSLARLRAEQRLLAITAASQVESGYAEHIWPFEMLSAISKESEFVSWQIVDDNGSVVLSDRPVPKKIGAELSRIIAPTESPVHATIPAATVEFWIVPLRMRAQSGAWLLRLGYDTSSVQAQIRDIILTNALAGLSLAVLLVGVSLIVMRKVLGPLDAVTRAATQMGQGNLSVSLPTAGHDEIGALVRGFSAMVSNIRERDAEIHEHLTSLEKARGELEMRVESRTLALNKAKAAAEGAAVSLRESDTRMRGIIEYAADAIVTLNDAGCIEVYNPAAVRVFGYPPDDVLGKPFHTLLPQEYSINLMGVCMEVEKADGRRSIGSSGEIRGKRKDGTTFPMQFALSQVRLEDKRLSVAIVHDISERRRAEEELAELHRRLVEASRQAGQAEVASDVLHNVGNILNSVNVSATMIAEKIEYGWTDALLKVLKLLHEHEYDLGAFLTLDERGKLVPSYLEKLATTIDREQRGMRDEVASLVRDIEHIKQIISMQQSYARVAVDVREPVSLPELMEDALRLTGMAALKDVTIVRDYAPEARAVIDRHKTLQILVNLINNAKHAIAATPAGAGSVTLRVRAENDSAIRMEVEDDGIGIPEANMVKIFRYGFSTKKNGHGFGLHGGALAAKRMGGTLAATSGGVGRGATFSLVVPCTPLTSGAADGEPEGAPTIQSQTAGIG